MEDVIRCDKIHRPTPRRIDVILHVPVTASGGGLPSSSQRWRRYVRSILFSAVSGLCKSSVVCHITSLVCSVSSAFKLSLYQGRRARIRFRRPSFGVKVPPPVTIAGGSNYPPMARRKPRSVTGPQLHPSSRPLSDRTHPTLYPTLRVKRSSLDFRCGMHKFC